MNAADAIAMRPRAEGEPAGRIVVSVREGQGAVTLAVSDDGVGLPREDRDRLTEPYVTHKLKGTGLGLAIVKKVMEDHGGRLSLEDRDGGPGAVASLILPAPDLASQGDGGMAVAGAAISDKRVPHGA